MKIKSSLFKIDSNIDGTYFNRSGELTVIENMIQAVGATDGPAAYPDATDIKADLPSIELSTIDGLTDAINTRGHGILYNSEGSPIAYKGDLVFRDGQGNIVNLNGALSKANSIQERGNEVYLRDLSLQDYNISDKGVSLDDMVTASIQKSTALGGGNIVQAVRNEEFNTNKNDVFTVRLSKDNHVWISCSALVNQASQIRLRDVSTDTILDVSYIESNDEHIVPVYLSYAGTLPTLVAISGYEAPACSPTVWNSFLKKYFKTNVAEDDSFVSIHQIRMEIIQGGDFIQGSVNLLAIDQNLDKVKVFSNQEIVINSTAYLIAFDEAFDSIDYSITIQAETPIQVWYDQKTENGFRIRFEREYNGNIFWSAVLEMDK